MLPKTIVRTDQTKVATLVKLFRKRRLQIFLRLHITCYETFPDAATGTTYKNIECVEVFLTRPPFGMNTH